MTAPRINRERSTFAGGLNKLLWIFFLFAVPISAAYVAWLALAQVNFFYPVWHDLIGIDRTIEIYGPQNRYRQSFELTSRAERSRLFAGIVDAIHDHGTGLEKLVYHDAKGRALGTLLREAEVVHLRDVAGLVDALSRAGVCAIVVTILLLLTIGRRKAPMPAVKNLLLGFLAPAFALAAVVVLAGPVDVFYWLHTLVFPPGHEWFFYYQDSLMSTMMMAPALFGCIALAWGLLTIVLLIAFIALARRTSRSRQKTR